MNYNPNELRAADGKWTDGSMSIEDKIQKNIDVEQGNITEGQLFDDRKKELGIPPAWTNVKINKDANADLLATGKDAKGRTQYIYSENATMKSAAVKFARNEELIKKQDYIVRQNEENMLSNQKEISEPAHVMSVIHATGIRPGSLKETGAKVQAYGATTLEGRHIIEANGEVRLQFIGKKGVNIDIPVTDSKVAKILIDRKKTSGDTGKLFNASDSDLRSYTKKLNGGGFKPKDFRTLKGTSTAMEAVKDLPRSKSMSEYKKTVMNVAKKVSSVLGNTPSIALKSYINPFVFLKIKPI